MRLIVLTDNGRFVSEIRFKKDPDQFLSELTKEGLLDVGLDEIEESTLFEERGSKVMEILLEEVLNEGRHI